MRLSVSLRSRHADASAGREAMLARAVAAREAGLHGLYVGDHHADGAYLQNNPMLGRLLAEWPGTFGAVYLLPLWHPVLLAEQVGTLASVAEAPFVLQCGLGRRGRQYAAMGIDPAERTQRFEAVLDVVRRLLAGEEVAEDRFFGIRGAAIAPVPRRPVETWIAGHAPAALDRAARMTDGWVCGPNAPFEEATAMAAAYREACARHGREPGTIAIRRDIHVAADEAEAQRVAQDAVDRGYRGFDPSVLVIGDQGSVADRLSALADAGFDEIAVRQVADGDDALASIARLATVREMLV